MRSAGKIGGPVVERWRASSWPTWRELPPYLRNQWTTNKVSFPVPQVGGKIDAFVAGVIHYKDAKLSPVPEDTVKVLTACDIFYWKKKNHEKRNKLN